MESIRHYLWGFLVLLLIFSILDELRGERVRVSAEQLNESDNGRASPQATSRPISLPVQQTPGNKVCFQATLVLSCCPLGALLLDPAVVSSNAWISTWMINYSFSSIFPRQRSSTPLTSRSIPHNSLQSQSVGRPDTPAHGEYRLTSCSKSGIHFISD